MKRKKTPTDRERIRSLEDRLDRTVARLDAAVAEFRRLSLEMDELQKRDPFREFRTALKQRFASRRPPQLDTYDSDETVN
jgi:hypothetical protein